jgi:hypothetical protein
MQNEDLKTPLEATWSRRQFITGVTGLGIAGAIAMFGKAALVDAATGNTGKAASDLDDAASQIANAVAKGTMSANQASQLLGDLSTLATAAGLPTPTAPTTTTTPTTTTPTTTTPTPPGGPGRGNQKPGKGPK